MQRETPSGEFCGVDEREAVIFAGSGATAGIQKLVHLFGADIRANTMVEQALEVWRHYPQIELLGSTSRPRLPIVSFQLRDSNGQLVHYQLVTRILSDRYGIQAREGCACAGPYVHRLLDIDCEQSRELRRAIGFGRELVKPGFVRVNFSPLMSNAECKFIIESICELASEIEDYLPHYVANPEAAVCEPVGRAQPSGVR